MSNYQTSYKLVLLCGSFFSLSEKLVVWEVIKKAVRNSIKKAKRKWLLLVKVDDDIRGNGYKIFIKGMLGFPSKLNLSNDFIENVVKYLFPLQDEMNLRFEKGNSFLDFSIEELCNACSNMKNNKSPGPEYCSFQFLSTHSWVEKKHLEQYRKITCGKIPWLS